MFHCVLGAIVTAGVLLVSSAQLVAQERGATESDVDMLRSEFFQAVKGIQISGGATGNQQLELQSKPLLNWSNPERKTPAGGLFLWTLGGRPQVALCLYPNLNQKVDLEFQSLALWPLVAHDGSSTVWNPTEAGIEMQPLTDAPTPAATTLGRLRQMRQMSRQFSAKLVPPNRTEIPLRMLATPLYRFAPPIASSKYVDGALFSFVQATDPEVLLLIEAVKDGRDELRWQYGLARMSMVPTEVTLGDELVWQTQWAIKNVSTPYYVYQIAIGQ